MKKKQTPSRWGKSVGTLARIAAATVLLISFQGGFLGAAEDAGCDLWCKINKGVSYCKENGDLCTYSRCFAHDPPTCYYVCAPSSVCGAA